MRHGWLRLEDDYCVRQFIRRKSRLSLFCAFPEIAQLERRGQLHMTLFIKPGTLASEVGNNVASRKTVIATKSLHALIAVALMSLSTTAWSAQSGLSQDNADSLRGFSVHDPMFFVVGAGPNSAKFQLSFKYRLIGDEKPTKASERPWYEGFFGAYSQTSFWNLDSTSSPFTDTSYRPALIYQVDKSERAWIPGLGDSYLRIAVQHESNGKGGTSSRSLNIVYAEAGVGLWERIGWELTARPRVWTYFSRPSDNPDIARYRGYTSAAITLAHDRGTSVVLSVLGNTQTGKGSFNADLTYPLQVLNFHPYINLQLFTGYGESLIAYDKRTTRVRLGLSIVR
jgi:outer membrane phospholipase A